MINIKLTSILRFFLGLFLQGKNQDKVIKDNIYLRNAHFIKDFITSKIHLIKLMTLFMVVQICCYDGY